MGVSSNRTQTGRRVRALIANVALILAGGSSGLRAAFIAPVVEKVRRIKAMVGDRPIEIEVDGGVTPQTAPLVAEAGANVLVAGSAAFKGGPAAYAANIAAIRQAAEAARG